MRTAAWIWIGLVALATVVGTIWGIVNSIRDDPEDAITCGAMCGVMVVMGAITVLTAYAIVIVMRGS